ncbi:hypothetical protein [Aeromicrobium sp.]|uniref:hypothetical protein n=1 Tax=Aeromicrobium sp. TaxID=1871063 RepID=UPI003D6ACC95
MRLRWVILAGLVTAAVLVTVVVRDREPVRGEYCMAEVGETRLQIDVEQARWTTLMAAISQRRGLPPRATTIAIATAFQESKIHNIDYGDRDSAGLFQQRPSQGWGTREQVLDPEYSIGRFYDGLVKVKGYQAMTITKAAQRVQRSAYPAAYAEHEEFARALASALRGYSPASFSCRVNPAAGGRTRDVADDVNDSFGDIPVEVDRGAVRVPLEGRAPDVDARGWGLAHYAVGNAPRLKIASVAFDGLVWTAEDSPDGWVVDRGAARDTVVIRVEG